jgi:hypothetical protein
MSKLFYISLESNTEKRLDLSNFLNFTDNYDPLTSDLLSEIQSLKARSNYKITDDALRPDKTSLKVYNDFQYWWIIMIYNNIFRVEDYVTGRLIQLPDNEALENYYFALSTKQIRTNTID